MGREGVRWAAGIEGYAVCAVTAGRRAVWSDGIDALLAQDPAG